MHDCTTLVLHCKACRRVDLLLLFLLLMLQAYGQLAYWMHMPHTSHDTAANLRALPAALAAGGQLVFMTRSAAGTNHFSSLGVEDDGHILYYDPLQVRCCCKGPGGPCG